MNKNGPYFITTLNTRVRVPPSNINGNLMINIKQLLNRDYKDKNYKDYGFLTEIYSISDTLNDNKLLHEDNSGSPYYDVTFTAKICYPIIGTIIVAKIEDIFKNIAYASNGPITFIIEGVNINTDKFRFNNNKDAWFPLNKDDKEINQPLTEGVFVNIRVIRKRIVPKNNKILSFGYLEGIPTTQEIKDSIENQNSNTMEPIDIQELLNTHILNTTENKDNDEDNTSSDEDDAMTSSDDEPAKPIKTKSKSKTETKTKSKSKTETKTKSKSKTETKTKSKSKTGTKTKSVSKPKTKSKSKSKSKKSRHVMKSKKNSMGYRNIKLDIKSDSDSDSDDDFKNMGKMIISDSDSDSDSSNNDME